MTNRAPKFTGIIVCLTMMVGCQPHRPSYRFESADLNYYVDQATEISYPDVSTEILDEVTQSGPPITNTDASFDSFWDLTLEDAVQIALQNTKVIRGYGTPGLQGTNVAAGVDNLSNGPAAAGTIYDVAVRESEPGFIGQPGQLPALSALTSNTGLDANIGVEAALAEFDAQLTSNLVWQRTDQPRNVIGTGLIFQPDLFQQDLVNWTTQIAKKSANGTQLFARTVSTYTANTIPTTVQPLSSVYQTALEFEIRQPLLRGRGTFINRAPLIISRINTDQVISNFESIMQNMVTNIEIRYWDLHCAYRNLQTAKSGRDAALATYRTVKENFEAGKLPLQDEAQSRVQYNNFKRQVEQAWADLLLAEGNFRWLLGVANNDRRLCRPIDEPTKARVSFDYIHVMDEALTYRPSLRQTRQEVLKRELALAQSKNGLLPTLDATALYRWLGLGDDLINFDDSVPDFPLDRSAALNTLTGGDFQEVEFGLNFGLPVGFRRELANVRNAQLKLAREIARIQDQELDVEREISQTLQAMEANYQLAVTGFNAWAAAAQELASREERFKIGVDSIARLLDAQQSRAAGENNYYRAVCEYNKLIALLHRRKGTILAYNGIYLSEGPWPNKAYDDARENARRRSASREINYGFTRPQVISQGAIYPPVSQGATHGVIIDEGFIDGTVAPSEFPDQFNSSPGEIIIDSPEQGNPSPPELIPTPAPTNPLPEGTGPIQGSGTRGAASPLPRLPIGRAAARQASAAKRPVDWNKFGLSRPDRVATTQTRAVIRQSNPEKSQTVRQVNYEESANNQ